MQSSSGPITIMVMTLCMGVIASLVSFKGVWLFRNAAGLRLKKTEQEGMALKLSTKIKTGKLERHNAKVTKMFCKPPTTASYMVHFQNFNLFAYLVWTMMCYTPSMYPCTISVRACISCIDVWTSIDRWSTNENDNSPH